MDRRLRLTQQCLCHGDVADRHRLDARQHQPHVVAGGQFAVPAHVPGGGPAQRGGQRLGELADAGQQRVHRVRVQADLGVGEVVVVDEHQVRTGLPGQLGHHGPLATDVGLDPAAAHQARRGAVVEPDRDPVVAQHRMCFGGLLADRELGERAVCGERVLGPQRVHPGGLQPLLRPAGQVPAGGRGQRLQQVAKGRIGPGVPAEVAAQPGQEVVQADVGDELLEHGGALGVGNAVEVDLDRSYVGHVRRDRVGRGKLVRLLQLGEGRPGAAPAGRLGLGQHRRPGGERLVQPQVVPPAHGDQVTEPHVRHLVQYRRRAGLAAEVGDPGPEHVVLKEGHAARVLHRAGLVLGHEQLVVLAERVAHRERAVEEVEPLPGHLENLVRVQVLGQRLAAVDAERDAVVLGPYLVIGACRDRGDVGGHQRRRREMPARGPVRDELTGHVRCHVRDDLPAGRHRDRELEGGLEVGLVEAGVDAVRVGGLEVGVEVTAAVHGVGEPVQALAAAGVGALGGHPQFVVGREIRQGDPVTVECPGPDRVTVERDRGDRRCGQVHERARAGTETAEGHRGH